MSLLDLLGLRHPPAAAGGASAAASTETVRKIVGELEALPADRARYVAAFAYLLSRVAHADLEISAEETREMERLLTEVGRLPEEQAILVVQIAKSQKRLFGGTEDYLVTREFKAIATPEERRQVLDCLLAVSAADDSISSAEETQVRQISSELGFTHADYVEALSAWNDKREVLRGLRPPAE
jgi:uncharacterized tellurite resistance protein B-like protein